MPRLRQEVNDKSYMLEIITLIEGVNDDGYCRWLRKLWKLFDWIRNELVKLILDRLVMDSWVGLDLVTNIRGQRRQLVDKLSNYRRKEENRTTAVAFAALEEEAGAKDAFVGEQLGYSSRDCRLARASHAVQPEDTFVIPRGAPCLYLLQNIGSSVGIALRIVGVGISIEARSFYGA